MDTATILMQAIINSIVQEVLKSEPIQLLVKATQDMHQAAGSKLLTNAADVTKLVERIEALETTIPTPSVETLAQYVLTHSSFIDGVRAMVREETGEWLTDGRNDTISDAVQACINNTNMIEDAVEKHLDGSDAVEDAIKSFLSSASVSVNVG